VLLTALFDETFTDNRLERPLRDFEIVTDVLSTWEAETTNALVIKRYTYRDSLTAEVRKMTKHTDHLNSIKVGAFVLGCQGKLPENVRMVIL
jgi:hypothetical protein